MSVFNSPMQCIFCVVFSFFVEILSDLTFCALKLNLGKLRNSINVNYSPASGSERMGGGGYSSPPPPPTGKRSARGAVLSPANRDF